MSFTSFFISLSSTRFFFLFIYLFVSSYHVVIHVAILSTTSRLVSLFSFFHSCSSQRLVHSLFFLLLRTSSTSSLFFPLQKCVIPVYNRTQTVLLLNMSPYFSSFKMHLHDSWNVCTPMQLCREKGFANICDRKLICCPNAYRQRRRAVGPVSS